MASGKRIIRGLRAAVSHATGERVNVKETVVQVPNSIDVRAIRERLGITQKEFAMRFGFSIGTLRHWEQGQRYPEGSARVLLKVIEHEPSAVERALAVG